MTILRRGRQTRPVGMLLGIAWLASLGNQPLRAQQKAQWVPGQYGLNAGELPDPGFTYQNLELNYSASQLNDKNGNPVSRVTGTYSFWTDENIFMYVPKEKILGGYFAPYADINTANGSLVALLVGTDLSTNGGGQGLADSFFAPFNLGWHFSRLDLNAGYGFTAPTGRYTPGASNNIGSGYWGNNLMAGATAYITKNKGTSANIYFDWEDHGARQIVGGGNVTPGQAITVEWGIGQVLPLDKQMNKLVQVGLVGYGQWQVSNNAGVTSVLPFYSVQAVGAQGNFILTKQELNFFFKYYDEYTAKARPQGRTIAFGGSWTLAIPKQR